MRSLVLGGSTFVGRRLVQQLAGQGHEVSVLNRGRTPSALETLVRRGHIGDGEVEARLLAPVQSQGR